MDLITDFTPTVTTLALVRAGGVRRIPSQDRWITDGVLKVAAGSSMVWLSY